MYCSVQHCTALHPVVKDTHQQQRLLDCIALLFTLHYYEVNCTEETVQNYSKGEGESSNKQLGISQIKSSQSRGHLWASRATTSHTQFTDVTLVGLMLNLHGTTAFAFAGTDRSHVKICVFLLLQDTTLWCINLTRSHLNPPIKQIPGPVDRYLHW